MSWENPTKEQRRGYRKLVNSVVSPNGYTNHVLGVITGITMMALGIALRYL